MKQTIEINSTLIFLSILMFQATMAQIELKQPEIERVAGEVKDLCRKQFLGDEDRDALQRKVGDLQMAWDELRTEAIEKETM